MGSLHGRPALITTPARRRRSQVVILGEKVARHRKIFSFQIASESILAP